MPTAVRQQWIEGSWDNAPTEAQWDAMMRGAPGTLSGIETGRPITRRMTRKLLGVLPRRVQLEYLGLPHRYGKP